MSVKGYIAKMFGEVNQEFNGIILRELLPFSAGGANLSSRLRRFTLVAITVGSDTCLGVEAKSIIVKRIRCGAVVWAVKYQKNVPSVPVLHRVSSGD
jgi:hypothetical protein